MYTDPSVSIMPTSSTLAWYFWLKHRKPSVQVMLSLSRRRNDVDDICGSKSMMCDQKPKPIVALAFRLPFPLGQMTTNRVVVAFRVLFEILACGSK